MQKTRIIYLPPAQAQLFVQLLSELSFKGAQTLQSLDIISESFEYPKFAGCFVFFVVPAVPIRIGTQRHNSS